MSLTLEQRVSLNVLKKKYGYDIACEPGAKEFMDSLDETSLLYSLLIKEFADKVYESADDVMRICNADPVQNQSILVAMAHVMNMIMKSVALDENHPDMIKYVFEEAQKWQTE